MDENTNVTTPEEKTFTQDELNAIVADRLAREKAKYEGFDELKAKAEKYDELEEANKSELQKASERVASLEAELESVRKTEEVRAIRDKVAKLSKSSPGFEPLPNTVASNFLPSALGSLSIRASYRAATSRLNSLEKGTITASL